VQPDAFPVRVPRTHSYEAIRACAPNFPLREPLAWPPCRLGPVGTGAEGVCH
jgi:hypothetical protein